MSAVLALFAEFGVTRVGVSTGTREAHRTVAQGEDPFVQGEALAGEPVSVVVVAGGDASYPWHPCTRLEAEARRYAEDKRVPLVIVRPMDSGDLVAEARLSGHKHIERRGVFYAVPQTAAFERCADALSIPREAARIVAVYLGDEVAVSAYRGGRVIDTSDPVACEGPFGLRSVGTLPAVSFLAYVSRRGADRDSDEAERLRQSLKEESGTYAIAGVGSQDELVEALDDRRPDALLAVSAMAYQVAKEVGRQLAALGGKADAIALCGPGTSIEPLASGIRERVSKWAQVIVFRGDLVVPYLLREGIEYLSSKQKM